MPEIGDRKKHEPDRVWLECPGCESEQWVWIGDYDRPHNWRSNEWECEGYNNESDEDSGPCGDYYDAEQWIEGVRVQSLGSICKKSRSLLTSAKS